jgi:hypothetical protein
MLCQQMYCLSIAFLCADAQSLAFAQGNGKLCKRVHVCVLTWMHELECANLYVSLQACLFAMPHMCLLSANQALDKQVGFNTLEAQHLICCNYILSTFLFLSFLLPHPYSIGSNTKLPFCFTGLAFAQAFAQASALGRG